MNRRELLQRSALAAFPSLLNAAPQTCEVCIYGATPGGIAAAVAAGRLGHSVILCEYEDHIGGIVSNGLTNADIGKR
ncbi:MAG: FAD-dependent oxidoreductase [Acidobacteria bacterium]|nr:FAD-dependent oxidoreductase [Acidobacteriota bacterium]